ncbi:uncharacterized protein LOC110648866 [Hevea brasiliensis]|uniref:uncharacterized protein LOC110648866 n=1 Tax=Hevea brasiliensis TaxID=3981 RepID=UPI0025D929E4|nr:uncharacterized protein LOC110648866 [Hevea brasiliensis]
MTTHRYINADLQEAAKKGKLDPFKAYQGNLGCLLTPNENTILHIYLTSSKKRTTNFIKEVVGICPSLLLQVNNHGDTPLHIAARCGHTDAAKELIERAKASVHHEIDIERGEGPKKREMEEMKAVKEMLRMRNKNEETALHEAARNEKGLDVVKEILNYEVHDHDGFKYSANDCEETPIYLAAENGCYEILDKLVCHQQLLSPTYGGPNGKTALHAAVVQSSSISLGQSVKLVMINKLMDRGKRLLGVTDERLWTSFQYAAHKEMIDSLLDTWSNLAKETDEKGWTPLHYAVYKGYTPVVRMLLDRDKDKSSAYIADNDWKRTALHIAACRGFQDIVKEIISKCPGCSELTDKRGWNVLHYAVISKSDKVIKEVLKHSSLLCLLNKKDVEGNTPVHLYKAYHPSLPAFIEKRDVFLFWRKLHYQITGYSSSKKNEILKLMTELGAGPLGEISNTEGEMRKEKMIHKFEKVKDSHLVAAALIATVTFAAAFTIPGGYISDENDLKKGTPILSKSWTFKAFIVSDTIAMVLSTCSVFTHLMLMILGFGEAYYWLIRCAFGFLFYAMVAMVITFVAGIYAVLAPSLGFGICIIGFSFFLFLLYSIASVSWGLYSSDDDIYDQLETFSWLTGGILPLLGIFKSLFGIFSSLLADLLSWLFAPLLAVILLIWAFKLILQKLMSEIRRS